MQDIDRIRRRIRKTHSARRPHRLVSAFHHLVLALMLVCVLGLSLSYIPVSRIIFSVITVTISSFLIDRIQDFGRRKSEFVA